MSRAAHLAAVREQLAAAFPTAAISDESAGNDIDHVFIVRLPREAHRLLVGWEHLDRDAGPQGLEEVIALLRRTGDGQQVVLAASGPRIAMAPQDVRPSTLTG